MAMPMIWLTIDDPPMMLRTARTMPNAATATPSAQAHGWSVHAPYANAMSSRRIGEEREAKEAAKGTEQDASRRGR